jgi:hypothetical protein
MWWYVLETVFFIAAGGVAFSHFSQRGAIVGTLALLFFLTLLSSSYKSVYELFFKSDPVPDNSIRQSSLPSNPSPAQPQTSHPSPRPWNPPEPDYANAVRTRMFMGTLPPDGVPALKYIVSNASGLGSFDNVNASAWPIVNGKVVKADARQVGYIAGDDGRVSDPISSPIPHGKALLCVSYAVASKAVDVLFFYESPGLYARYGPMLEMKQFRDPVLDTQGHTCAAMPQAASRYL